jgi:hypothetical protein
MAEPRRLNVVTLLMLLGLAAGGYWFWKFFPVYYTGWQVDHLLSEAGAESYQVVRLGEGVREAKRAEIERSTRERIVALGVDDPDLRVTVELEPKLATVTADYEAVVQHPVAGKRTVLAMHRSEVTDLQRVKW